MNKQEQIVILENLCKGSVLFSYSEIYKIDKINDSCFIVYLFQSLKEKSQHIFVFCKDEDQIKLAEYKIQKDLSLQKKMKNFHLYLCIPDENHLMASKEYKNEVHYKITFTEPYLELEKRFLKTKLKIFPKEKTSITYFLSVFILFLFAMDYASSYLEFLKPWFQNIGVSIHHYIENDLYNMFFALFSHHGLTHLGFNLVSLIYIGRILERHFSTFQYWFIIIFSGMCGALGSVAFIPQSSVSVGASGFIMGLIGALIAVSYQSKGVWPEYYQYQFLRLRQSLMILMGLNLLVPLFIENIDSAAHVCGFLSGLILGILFKTKKQYKMRSLICVGLYFFIYGLESQIDKKVHIIFDFQEIQNELIFSLNTKENMMKRNILEISELNSNFLFELSDINKVNYPLTKEVAARDILLKEFNFHLVDAFKIALTKKNQNLALNQWKLKYDQIESKLLIKYKLIKANANAKKNTK